MSNPDVITGEAPHRYARALLGLAEESRALKTVEKDIASFKAIFAGSEAIQSVAGNAVYASDEKAAALTAIAKKAGIGKLVTNFIGVVAQNRRAGDLPTIMAAFEMLVARRRGSEIAKVTSAKKLTAAQTAKLKSELKKSLGRSVDIEADVDPDLLGGFVVRIGSRLYDSSLKTQIEDLKLALKEA